MASILVTGCGEDGADQSANVASGLTSPRPLHTACLRISRPDVYTSRGEDRLKNRASPASRRSGVTLTPVPRILLAHSDRADADATEHASALAIARATTSDIDEDRETGTSLQKWTHTHTYLTCKHFVLYSL